MSRGESAAREEAPMKEWVEPASPDSEGSPRGDEDGMPFDYEAAHEIKSQLRAIDGYARLFIDGYASVLGPNALGVLENIRRVCLETLALASRLSDDLLRDIRASCVLCVEKEILGMIGENNIDVPAAFAGESDRLERLIPPGDPRLSHLRRGLYLNIVSEIFKKYPWLRHYKSASRYEKPEMEGLGHGGSYRGDIEELLGFVDALLPDGVHGTLRGVCDFILENPDMKISLQLVSEKFFINRTYLSNLFHQKTGCHFNKYITLVKLSRARFLFENSGKKISEIGYYLGYNDFSYFNRIYKKFSGVSPPKRSVSDGAGVM
jgi:AraC-like DNA-binding protein